jgi:hypothetical protein
LIKANTYPFYPSSAKRLFFHLAIGHKDQLSDDLVPMLNGNRLSRLAFARHGASMRTNRGLLRLRRPVQGVGNKIVKPSWLK